MCLLFFDMKHPNSVTRFLRVFIHFWWYLTILATMALAVYFTGNELGLFKRMSRMSIPIGWELKESAPQGELTVKVKDSEGKDYPVIGLKGEGELVFRYGDNKEMGKLAFLTYFTVGSFFFIALFGVYQLRLLFDDLASGRYFEEVNALRIRRISYCLFALYLVNLATQLAFELSFSVQTGKNIQLDGVEIGLNPILLSGLFLITLSEVFREGAKLRQEHSLTI